MNSPLDLSIPFERITWRDGQELDSRDLRDSQSNAERFRHLHIHYQHKTWGVVEGLSVVAAGTSAAAVTNGYALDIEGAEMLIPTATLAPVPANLTGTSTMYLVISRSGESGCSCDSVAPPDLATLCPGIPHSASLWKGLLSWKTVKQVRVGRDVLLARAVISNGTLTGAIDTSVQRRAATMAQPRIWSDSTPPGQTGWTDTKEGWVSAIRATVDTSSGGFLATPAYFAWLTGASPAVEGFISTAGTARFTFELRQMVVTQEKWDAATANSRGWAIRWFAVELPPPQLLYPYITA